MRSSLRGLSLGAFAVLAAFTTSNAMAAAAEVLPTKSYKASVAKVERRFCATKAVTGRGVSRRTVTSPVSGTIAVWTNGPASADWDLGIVDAASGNALNGAATTGADELATAFVRDGQRLVLQTCRRDGAANLRVSYAFTRLPRAEPSTYKTKLVRVTTVSAADKQRLAGLGLDTTDHPGEFHWDVLLHTAAQERRLKASGLGLSTRIADVRAHDRANRLKEQRAGRARAARLKARAAIVSGRTSYRTLPEIQEELKRLAEQNPGLVRLFKLPINSWENREIMGVEIAENVSNPPDGRPHYVQIGTHHAREWPANEATLEFGLELVNGFKTGNPRLTNIVRNARTIVIPVLNVDGFDVTIQSEGLTPGGNYVDPLDSTNSPTGSGNQGAATGAYKRKNCRPLSEPPVPEPQGTCLTRSYPNTAASTDQGVDPNRNYGVEWGGPGTETTRTGQTWHGPGPFSEPETESFRRFVRNLQPAVLITNHTFTGLILRPPGTATFGPVPDEERLRALGDAMARETAYVSQYSYQLYDTTGTTDDYLYDGLGAFSFTPEIGKAEFHPAFSEFVAEYDGRPEVDRFEEPTGRTLGGLREAFTLAGETAIDAASHSVMEGVAPAGRTLRIKKTIAYKTSERPDDNGVQYPVQTITEPRESTLVVPATGRFTWHVNPSGQPRAAEQAAWDLTCEDGAGNVLERRRVFVDRSQSVNLGTMACGVASTPVAPQPTAGGTAACKLPDGFSRVDAKRRGRGLRIDFTRTTSNGVTVDVFQTSTRRRVFVQVKRVKRFRNRSRSFTWDEASRLADGVYFVRFRTLDSQRRVDSRRVVVERRNGRFAKRGSFYLKERCGG
jgi:hypothetical protein